MKRLMPRYLKWLVKRYLVKPNYNLENVVGQGSISARYCYSVFMRHMVMLYKDGMKTMPVTVAEFGPGNSLGLGLCFLLAGSREYYAFDIMEHANLSNNIQVLDELITLFKNKAPIPDEQEFPDVRPNIADYSFPSYIFSDAALESYLTDDRLENIKNILMGNNNNEMDIKITYIAPWEDKSIQLPQVDLVISQAVLEHIDNLSYFYEVLSKILVKGGFSSHEIDFRCHGATYEWNGHWAVLDSEWTKNIKEIPFFINRQPLSTHLLLLKEFGFEILENIPDQDGKNQYPSIKRRKLTTTFQNLSEDDFKTQTCYVLSKKGFSL